MPLHATRSRTNPMSLLKKMAARSDSSFAGSQSAPQNSHNCLPAGTRLEDFEITEVIGEGGFGIVYLAFDHVLHRTVAIKEYMPGALAWRGDGNSVLLRAEQHRKTFQTGLDSFINEARLLAQLDHPALIRVYRYWESNNTGYMAMRYYEGRTLQDVIRNDPDSISCAWLKAVMSDIMAALEVLHSHQILHRDISPENIIILPNGAPVLLDFGAARRIIGNMSQALTVILKPGYAPVEQYADDSEMKQGPWTDVYALCGVIYAAIQKKAPPTSIARMIKDPLVPLHQSTLPGYDPAFLLAIDKGLAVVAENRPQSMQELRQLIEFPQADHAHATVARIAPIVAEPVKTPSEAGTAAQPASPAPVVAEKPRRPIWRMLKAEVAGLAAATKAQIGMLRKSHVTVLGLACLLSVVSIYIAQGETSLLSERSNPVVLPNAASAPLVPAAAPVADTLDNEAFSWAALEKAGAVTEEDLANHLRLYPDGRYNELVLKKMEQIRAQARLETLPSMPTAAIALLPGEEIIEFPDGNGLVSVPVASSSDQMGIMRLQIKPWAMVSVDGKGMGASPPLREIKLKEGTHTITLSNPAFVTKTMAITITSAKPFSLKHDFYADHKRDGAR